MMRQRIALQKVLFTYFTYVSGNRTETRVSQGWKTITNRDFVSATDWSNHGTNGKTNYLPDYSYTFPTQTTTKASGIKTTYTYTFWAGTDSLAIKTRTATLPIVATSQNGSGVATTSAQYYDDEGRLRWTKDGEGVVNYYSYNPDTGGQAYMATDVPNSYSPDVSATDWVIVTSGGADTIQPTRGTQLATALNFKSKTYYDDQGRSTKSIDQAGNEHFTVYEEDRTIRFPFWDSSTSKCQAPIQVTEIKDGQVYKTYAVKLSYSNISVTSSEPTGFSTEPTQADYVSLTKYTYDELDGRQLYVDNYHDIPSSGNGTLTTNFYRFCDQVRCPRPPRIFYSSCQRNGPIK